MLEQSLDILAEPEAEAYPRAAPDDGSDNGIRRKGAVGHVDEGRGVGAEGSDAGQKTARNQYEWAEAPHQGRRMVEAFGAQDVNTIEWIEHEHAELAHEPKDNGDAGEVAE